MSDLRPIYDQLLSRLHASEALEKQASEDALIKKAGTDLATLHMLKCAASPLMKGLMYGAGAAIPAGLVGAGLIHQAGNESRKTVEDVRNKALQTALGIAALGGGLYALHRTTKPDTKTQTIMQRGLSGELEPVRQMETKVSYARVAPQTVLEKLATVGFLDVVFENQTINGPDDPTRRKAAECRLLNAEHGADLLRQLLD